MLSRPLLIELRNRFPFYSAAMLSTIKITVFKFQKHRF